MAMGFYGKSALGIGYIPAWIKVCYREGMEKVEVTFDIDGSIEYDTDSLSCRCKCELIPWVMSVDGEEIDLCDKEIEELDLMFPTEKVLNIFRMGTEYVVGIYPASESGLEVEKKDKLTDCVGYCNFYVGDDIQTVNFEFDTEIFY